MNPNDERIARDLRDFPVPPPPAGLLAKIQAEIPDAATLAGGTAPVTGGPRRWPLRLAATLALAALGGTVAWQVVEHRQGNELDRQAAEFKAAPAPQSGATSAQPPSPPSPPSPAAPKAAVQQRTVGEPVVLPLPESFLVKERQGSEIIQPVTVPEAVPEAAFEDRAAQRRTAAVDQVGGGVEGGVAGGSPGEALSNVASSAAAAPAPATQGYLEERAPQRSAAVSQSARKMESPARGDERERDIARQAPPDTMIFRATPANRFVDTMEDRLSTFALDVDTGSYTLIRGYLDRGILPPPAAIRVEEFVNAQSYDDPGPRHGDFALVAEGAPSRFLPGEHTRLLRFSVRSREVDPEDRKSAVLTFVVDVSGSMDRENRLGLVKRALGLLLDELRPDDRVGLVVYGTQGRVLLRHTRDLEEIRRAIAELRPEGSTNVEEGLRLAYDLADEGWRQGASNRIILCSDGVANVGATGPESILARIGSEAQRGIALTTVGFGMGNYNDALMEQLADQGDGTYHYVDALAEARRVFVENLTGTLETVAREAKAQIEFNSETVARWRLLGYENRDVADRDFRNDHVDAGELGSGHQATALYEVRLRDGISGGERLATLRLRWKSVAEKRVVEDSRELRARDVDRTWEGASANLRLAAVAAAFAEKLKETPAADDLAWRTLVREAGRLGPERPRNRSAWDLAESITRAARIAGNRRPRDEEEDERQPNPRLGED